MFLDRWLLALIAVLSSCTHSRLEPCGAPARFSEPQRVAVGRGPQDAVAGDLSGDGITDLVTADYLDRRAAVWLGLPDGGFTGPAGTLEPDVHLLALADMNRDGHLDLVATHHDQAEIYMAFGDGRGGLSPAPGSPFLAHAGRPHNHGLLVGDVNGDGAPDIITFNQVDRSVSVLLGEGQGSLAPAPGSPISMSSEVYPGALGDLDADGHLDLAVPLLTGHAVAVLRGDGRGQFTPAPGSPYSTIARPYYAAIGDFDRDGRADVLVAHDDSAQLTLLNGQPNGSFARAEGAPFTPGARVFALAAADFDGDGALDVAAGAGDRVMLLRGALGRPFTRACKSDLSSGKSWMARVADVDGDRRPDLIAPGLDANSIFIWR